MSVGQTDGWTRRMDTTDIRLEIRAIPGKTYGMDHIAQSINSGLREFEV